jgi:hypothetical protein
VKNVEVLLLKNKPGKNSPDFFPLSENQKEARH